MGSLIDAVGTVTNAKAGISEGIRDASLTWLLDTPACKRCVRYLTERDGRDRDRIDLDRERLDGGTLLFVLAAMQLDSEENTLEALRQLATRNVDTRGISRRKRLRKAGEARARPITSERHYERAGYAKQMQQQIADELYGLVSHLDILEQALAIHGDEAVARYL